MAKEITSDVVQQITRNLVQFGYDGLTEVFPGLWETMAQGIT